MLRGQDRGPGGDAAQQRHVTQPVGATADRRLLVVDNDDGPGLGRIPAQDTGRDQTGEMGVDRGGGGQSDGIADLAHRGWVTPVLDRLPYVIEYLLLSLAEH